jgi:hypothetical protein
MAVLSNNISSQNIVDRFADYVQATANSSISWGTNAYPQAYTGPTNGTVADYVDCIPFSEWGGSTGGKGIEISGGSLSNPIDASNIYNTLVAETNRYTRIRNVRALFYVNGDGGNLGDRRIDSGNFPGQGSVLVYDGTTVAHMNANFAQSVGSPGNGGVASGNTITTARMEALFDSLRTSYSSARGNTYTYTNSVCHSSCHSACHSSRGRR